MKSFTVWSPLQTCNSLADLHHAHRALEVITHDPFLVVRPSLNDSVLVKQGLVAETTLPLPIHNAYDVQVCIGIRPF